MNLTPYYEELYKQSIDGIRAGNHHVDQFIDSPDDRRVGITLLIRPSLEIRQRIQLFLDELRHIDPAQYYYPISDIHITVMSIIGCYDGFDLKQISLPAYETRIEKAINKTHSFRLCFAGVTASDSCLMIPGFPENDQLNSLRNDLREIFMQSNLQQSIDARYSIRTAHSTVVRFRKQLVHPTEYVNVIEEFRNKPFGEFEVKHAELVYNDWYQRVEKTRFLTGFQIGNNLSDQSGV